MKIKKILILRSTSQTEKDELLPLLTDYAEGEVEYSQYLMKDMIVKFVNNNLTISLLDRNILDFDLVYFKSSKKSRSLAAVAATFLKYKKRKFLDPYLASLKNGDKGLQLVTFACNKIPTPQSMYIVSPKKNLELLISNLKDLPNFPLIFKDASSHRGKNNYLVKDLEELCSIVNAIKEDTPYILQEYIPNSFDYRLLILGNKVKVAEKRIRKDEDSHMNNVSQGSTEEFIDPLSVKDLNKIAINTAKAFDMHTPGVDIIVATDSKKPYVIEINASSAFTFDNISTETLELHKYLKSLL